MNFDNFVKRIVLFSLFIATIGTGYIFFITIVLKSNAYKGFFNSWQFPMLLAILVEIIYYKQINTAN